MWVVAERAQDRHDVQQLVFGLSRLTNCARAVVSILFHNRLGHAPSPRSPYDYEQHSNACVSRAVNETCGAGLRVFYVT